MEQDTLKQLYIEELKDLYSAEQQIIKALPKMIKKATDPKLKRAFSTHLRQTEGQAKRLERVCRMLGESPTGKKCVGMKGLIDEAKELISEKPDPAVLDAGLISKAQHVEHYEMAGYGTVRTYARLLGYADQADLLQATLDEEGETDKLLTSLSESINVEAIAPDDEGDDAGNANTRSKRSAKGGARRSGGSKRTAKSSSKRGSASRKRAGAASRGGSGSASKKRASRRGASSRGALARHRSGDLHDRAKSLIGA